MSFFLKQEQQFGRKTFPPYGKVFYCLRTSGREFVAK